MAMLWSIHELDARFLCIALHGTALVSECLRRGSLMLLQSLASFGSSLSGRGAFGSAPLSIRSP